MRKINEIILHCTATPAGMEVTVEEIDRWHRRRGFESCGYHYVVYLDGSVHLGRPVALAGAHCKGHNAHSIGVCYVGGLDWQGRPANTLTPEQDEALAALVKRLMRQHGVSAAAVRGHCEHDHHKACPCFNVPWWKVEKGLARH